MHHVDDNHDIDNVMTLSFNVLKLKSYDIVA